MRACPAVIWVLIAPLGTGSLRGAQACPRVVWGISWGAARLLLSLRPGQVCLKHTPVLGSDSRTELLLWLLWPPCGQWAVREQPGTVQHSSCCTSCSHTTQVLLPPQSALTCCSISEQMMRRPSKGKGHLPHCHSTSNSQLIFPTHTCRSSPCLSPSQAVHSRQWAGPVLTAAFIMLGNDLWRIQCPNTSAGHSSSICAAKSQL